MPSGTSAVRANAAAGAAGVYETWLFAPGALALGMGAPANAEGTDRNELTGEGSGHEWFVQRLEWLPHFPGHSYTGTAASGGPSNGSGSNNLNNAGSFNRIIKRPKIGQVREIHNARKLGPR